jgi:hypothetical protein
VVFCIHARVSAPKYRISGGKYHATLGTLATPTPVVGGSSEAAACPVSAPLAAGASQVVPGIHPRA